MTNKQITLSDKLLLTLYQLRRGKKEGLRVTKEDLAVKAWQMYPDDFCLKGYLQYPDADIARMITTLITANFVQGNHLDYKLTLKGKQYSEKIRKGYFIRKKEEHSPEQVAIEVARIKNSQVYKYFIGGGEDFTESDLFEFLGTTSRTFGDSNRTTFLSRFNLISKDVIPYCERIKDGNGMATKIVLLWNILLERFKTLLSKKV